MSKIQFGKPYLQIVRRVQKYELHGVAFVEGFEKTVGLTFECHYRRNCMLTTDDLYQAKEVYRFFSDLLKGYSEKKSGLRKGYLGLFMDWTIVEGKVDEALDIIEKAMGSDWKQAFQTILSVHEK